LLAILTDVKILQLSNMFVGKVRP